MRHGQHLDLGGSSFLGKAASWELGHGSFSISVRLLPQELLENEKHHTRTNTPIVSIIQWVENAQARQTREPVAGEGGS